MPPRPRKPEGLFITEGGRKLKQYLELHGLGVVEFAASAGVSRVTLAQVMNGERWKHITVAFALRIQAQTKGLIKVDSFDPATAKPVDDDGEDEGPPVRRRRSGLGMAATSP